jgi:hypothetical protein
VDFDSLHGSACRFLQRVIWTGPGTRADAGWSYQRFAGSYGLDKQTKQEKI